MVPAGPEIDMGGWTRVSFSPEQQAKFSVTDAGEIVDQAQHEAALAEHKASGGGAELADFSGKTAWPELVGTDADEATSRIVAERPELKVNSMPEDSMVTMDYREDRVRVIWGRGWQGGAAPNNRLRATILVRYM